MRKPSFKEDLEKEIEEKYIRRQSSPDGLLSIYTYTQNCEFDNHWNAYTLTCRGLVLDNEYNPIILCIPKFFNIDTPWAEKLKINKNCQITEKNDGYLIQIKKDSQYGLVVTSKGSFSSPMVDKALELINKEELKEDWTYICELCCNFPGDESLIVKRWNGTEKLVCWAVRDEEFEEQDISTVELPPCLERVKVFSVDEANQYLKRTDVEGVVLQRDHLRVKVKTEHFFKMHKLISDITKKHVFEIISDGHNLEDIEIPDEFIPQMQTWEQELKDSFNKHLLKTNRIFREYKNKTDKELALSDEDPFYKGLVFSLRKEKDPTKAIWRKIKQEEL